MKSVGRKMDLHLYRMSWQIRASLPQLPAPEEVGALGWLDLSGELIVSYDDRFAKQMHRASRRRPRLPPLSSLYTHLNAWLRMLAYDPSGSLTRTIRRFFQDPRRRQLFLWLRRRLPRDPGKGSLDSVMVAQAALPTAIPEYTHLGEMLPPTLPVRELFDVPPLALGSLL
jgi:hypothetical protein